MKKPQPSVSRLRIGCGQNRRFDESPQSPFIQQAVHFSGEVGDLTDERLPVGGCIAPGSPGQIRKRFVAIGSAVPWLSPEGVEPSGSTHMILRVECRVSMLSIGEVPLSSTRKIKRVGALGEWSCP